METDCEHYKIVYECYESRILFGYYGYGDRLPSLPEICDYFRMPPATVRFALSRLEEAGYIQLVNRKPARVTYAANLQKYRRNMAEYFALHREGIEDILASGGVLLSALVEQEIKKWDDEIWKQVTDDLFHPHSGGVSAAVRFYDLVFEASGNNLIQNLYAEIIRYLQFPYLADDDAPPQVHDNATREEALELFLKSSQEKLDYAVAKLFNFIDRASEEFSLETAEQIPFRLNVYRNRPQMRYTVASVIIQEIVGGRYPVGSYLPSLPQLAEQHGVGQNTVRRALEILGKLGVTETFHGKGTLACMEPVEIDFADPDLSEGLRLFMESLQMLALTIQPVLCYVLAKASPEQKQAHAQQFAHLRETKESYRGIDLCMTFIGEVCPRGFIQECYRKIRELLAWGYPFALRRSKEEGRSIHAIYAESMERIETELREGNDQAVSEEWKKLLESDVKAYVSKQYHCG